MFLKSLTLKGFKSFAETTTLEFEPGVTVVVGPNGSGKSNIVDAVAWVLGAQGPRTVRSSKMEDVIFAGTPSRPALGRAEVALTIDNSAGLLPIEFSEVTITRTLFRTGDSEYAINGVPCRLLDVQELLSDTGVGRQQHVIVSQGNLDAVLNARPEERRLIVEEAAGVLKYRRRKEKAERRLESTEASLTRLQDLLREVRRQLRPLERQAEAARRHDELRRDLTGLRRHLVGRELAAVESRLARAGRERTEATDAEGEQRAALAALDRAIADAEAESTGTDGSERTDLVEAVSRAERLCARAAGAVAVLEERRRSLARERTRLVDGDLVAALEGERAELTGQLEAAEAEAAALAPQREELQAAERSLAAEEARLQATWAREAPADGGNGPAAHPLAEARSELSALRSVVERGRAELRRVRGRAEAAGVRANRLEVEVERLRATLAECAQADIETSDELAAAETALQAAALAEQAAVEARRHAEGEAHRWSARAEALAHALDESRARTGAERLADVDGVVGALLELVEVDQGWEQAFHAAAGEALSSVVVENPAAARQAFQSIRDGGDGGAVVLPGNGDRASDAGGGISAGELGHAELGHAAPMRPHVHTDSPPVAAVLDGLLRTCVVVQGWAAALDLALRRPDLTVVTPDGDRCRGGVWRTGPATASSNATRAALEEARRRQVDAEAAAVQRARQQADAVSALSSSRARTEAAARVVTVNRANWQAAAEALRRAEAQLADVQRERMAGQDEEGQLADRLSREERRVQELEDLLPQLEQRAEAEAERAASERLARTALADRMAAVAELRRQFEVRTAGLRERRELLERRRGDIDARLARQAADAETAAQRRVALDEQAGAVERLLRGVTGRAARLDAAADRLRRARQHQAEEERARRDRLEQLRGQRASAERQLAALLERANRAQVEQAEARVRLEALTDAVRRELDCEPDATREAPCPPLPPGTSPTSRVQELERELRLLGPVNPLAMEEYDALRERHEFLEGQLDDVRAARRELGKVIRAVDGEIAEVLGAAWQDVAEHFERLFATLFPGGQGRLLLTDPSRLLNTGIEVDARPAGKNVRRLSLLSGGERSLVALAFLFAVFRSRPSPFYLMDEVEAALDDVSLHRFLDLLHEFRQEAQVLVVTHQKRTMEAADCLYGVTMAPGGSSRVVSERVRPPAAASAG